MPDRRRHRGSHPSDAQLFSPETTPILRRAAHDYRWLLAQGYAGKAAMELVGDRFQLKKRQRDALWRAVSRPETAARRQAKACPIEGADIVVDGLNVVLTVESILADSLILLAEDGLIRDLASVHGTYRLVDETRQAVADLSEQLAPAASVRWLIDRPVSNSGRLAAMVREAGWDAETTDDVDRKAANSECAVATSDGPLADNATAIVDLVGPILAKRGGWVLDLRDLDRERDGQSPPT